MIISAFCDLNLRLTCLLVGMNLFNCLLEVIDPLHLRGREREMGMEIRGDSNFQRVEGFPFIEANLLKKK